MLPQAPRRTHLAAYAACVAAAVSVSHAVNRIVPEPYMDEIFHVPQAQAYCRGDWRYWDPALTTPPGLYLLPAFLAHLQRVIAPLLPRVLGPGAADPCSLASLRRTNLALACALPILYARLIRRVTTIAPARERASADGEKVADDPTRAWEPLVVALFPLLGWWAWLYYTDLPAVVLVLSCWACALERRWVPSALLGAASLLFRQTNIVWVLFVAAQAAVREVSRAGAADRVRDPLLVDAQPSDLLRTPLSLARAALSHPRALVPVIAAYAPVFAAAGAFVQWNGGIVLGDKSNHAPTVHVPQVYYLVASAAAFFAPHVLGVSEVRGAAHALGGSATRLACSPAVLLGMCWTIKHYTIAHPFLLSDNRHYAFYLWRRLLNVTPWARYALSPAYLASASLLFLSLAGARTMRLSTLVLLCGASTAVLVPTPLLEPRYFLVPLVVSRVYLVPAAAGAGADVGEARAEGSSVPHKRNHAALRRRRARLSSSPSLSASHRRTRLLLLEAALYLSIHALTLYLFLWRPFRWEIPLGADGRGLDGRDEREVGRWQRFMW